MQTEELKALGLNDEQAKRVFALHGQSLNAEKAKLQSDLEMKESQIKDLNEQLKGRDKDIKKLKEGVDEETQKTISEMQEKHKTELKEANDKVTQAVLDGKISEALGLSKARNVDLLRKALNSEEISLNSEGELIGLKEQLSKLQETDAYLFDLGTTTSGKEPDSGNPDAGLGGANGTDNDFAAFAAENRIIK